MTLAWPYSCMTLVTKSRTPAWLSYFGVRAEWMARKCKPCQSVGLSAQGACWRRGSGRWSTDNGSHQQGNDSTAEVTKSVDITRHERVVAWMFYLGCAVRALWHLFGT